MKQPSVTGLGIDNQLLQFITQMYCDQIHFSYSGLLILMCLKLCFSFYRDTLMLVMENLVWFTDGKTNLSRCVKHIC